MLDHWSNGFLECWSDEVMEKRNNGMME